MGERGGGVSAPSAQRALTVRVPLTGRERSGPPECRDAGRARFAPLIQRDGPEDKLSRHMYLVAAY